MTKLFPGTEQVLVAVSYYNGDGSWCSAVIIAWTPGGWIESQILCLTDDDVLSTRDGDVVSDPVPREKGLWLWEGVPVCDRRPGEEGDGLPAAETSDSYLMLGGEWRRPTVWELIAMGVVDGSKGGAQ